MASKAGRAKAADGAGAGAVGAAKAKGKAKKGKLIIEVDIKGKKLQIVDAPIPADCHAEKNADYDGTSVEWGLGHKAASAAECCSLCKTYKQRNPAAEPCNVWVWCGDPSGVCWTMDIWNHTTGDCWLKFQKNWDNNPDRSKSNLAVNHRGKFPEKFRQEHSTAPELIPWTAGVVVPPKRT